MPLSLVVDNIDLTAHLRVAPGEGLDPFDADLIEPSFTDGEGLEGPELLAVVAGSREMQWPLHLAPAKRNLFPANSTLVADTTAPYDASGASETNLINTGSTITRSATPGPQTGVTALQVTTPNVANFEGVELVCPGVTFRSGVTYKLAMWIKGNSGIEDLQVFIGGSLDSNFTILTDVGTSWRLVTVEWTPSADRDGASHGLAVRNTSQAGWMWFIALPTVTIKSPTKQDLHSMVRDLNGELATAAGGRLLWQDGSADNPTVYDMMFARFEPEYNFRRQERLWQTGVLRVWTRPYGHIGTHRVPAVSSAVATGVGVPVSIPAGEVGGDMSAMVEAYVGAPSLSNEVAGRIVGLAAVPSGYTWDIPAGSLSSLNVSGTASWADRFGIGSWSMALFTAKSGENMPQARFNLSPATMYAGRNRVLAITRGMGKVVALDQSGQQIGQGAATVVSRPGHNVVDLGVLDVKPMPGQGTVTVNLAGAEPDQRPWDYQNWIDTWGVLGPLVNRIVVLPESSFALVADNRKRLIGWDNGTTDGSWDTRSEVTDLSEYEIDLMGNEVRGIGSLTGFMASWTMRNRGIAAGALTVRDGLSGQPSTLIPSGVVFDTDYGMVDVDGHVSYRFTAAASGALGVGKYTNNSSGRSVGLMYHQSNATQAVMTLWSHWSAGSLIASKATGDWLTDGTLRLRTRGPVIEGLLYTQAGSLVATIVGSHAGVAWPGDPFLMMNGTKAFTAGAIHGWLFEDAASLGIGPRDRVLLAGASGMAVHQTSASVVVKDVTDRLRGQMPQLSPSIPQNLVALQLPVDGYQRSADAVSLSVSLLERWRFAR